jgi:hypothetical protein
MGFNQSNHGNFLAQQDLSWTEYLEDIYNNYSSYDTGTDSTHYFYVVVENRFRWIYLWDGQTYQNWTRGVFRFKKSWLIDAWSSGEPITNEVIQWKLYGESDGDDWSDLVSGNDECHNQVVDFGSSWAHQGENDGWYSNTWSEVGGYNCGGGKHRPALNLNIKPPVIAIEEVPEYEEFFNMGGKTLSEVMEERHTIFVDEELGGYNIYFDEYFNGLEGLPFTSAIVYDDWRPISNVFIGDNYLTSTYLHTYYDFDTYEYFSSSAPNIVNLYFTIQDGAYNAQIVEELFGQEYYQKIIDIYESFGMSGVTIDDLLDENRIGLSQNLKFFVFDWNWKEDDLDFEDIEFPYTETEMLNYNYNENIFIVTDAFNADGSPNMLQHQYNSPGLKVIKAFVMTTVTNFNGDEHVLVIKSMTVRINLGLDDVYIEDFADIGGPDFTFIPWPYTSPIVGGIDNNSQYIKSLNRVVDNNLFSDNEVIDRLFARKAVINQEIGQSLGSVDMEQTRFFLDGTYDMAKLLGIEESYNNVFVGTTYTYYPYDKFEGSNRWDGINNKYPEETSVGSIFINDIVDLNLLKKCLFELNLGSSDGRTIRDSSGNGNKGILIGDFKVKKEAKDIPIRRDSVMKTPSTGKDKRAI